MTIKVSELGITHLIGIVTNDELPLALEAWTNQYPLGSYSKCEVGGIIHLFYTCLNQTDAQRIEFSQVDLEVAQMNSHKQRFVSDPGNIHKGCIGCAGHDGESGEPGIKEETGLPQNVLDLVSVKDAKAIIAERTAKAIEQRDI